MDEYFGSSAKNYKQPTDKFFTLFPALDRVLPKAKAEQSLIDLACGTGDLFDFVMEKGYAYTGVDVSKDMLAQAKQRHPSGKFLHGDATKLALKQSFDVVLCNMLLPSVQQKEDFCKVFSVAAKLLTNDGLLVLGTGHPCFNGYMGKKFFGRTDIETTFEGYFQSGRQYKILRKFADSDFVFTDYHWTLTDYLTAAAQAKLQLVTVDECPLTGNPSKEVVAKFTAKGTPSFIVFVFKKSTL